LDAAQLATAVALRAALRLRARLGPAAVAARADDRARHLDLPRRAEDCLLEADLEVVAQVGAARRPAAGPARAGAAEGLADVLDAEAGRAGAEALRAGVAEAVVDLALLAVAEDLVGLIDLLEARAGAVLPVDVRVVLTRQAAEGAPDVVLAGVARDAEHFVV